MASTGRKAGVMTAPVTVSERDLHTLLGVVTDDRGDLPEHGGLPLSLLSELTDQIRCDSVSFFGASPGLQEFTFGQGVPDEEDDDIALAEALVAHYWDCQQCSYPERSGDLRTVTKPSDFYSVRQWRGTGMYCDYFRPLGVEHLLVLSMPEAPGTAACPGSIARMIFFRGPGREFSERDRALLALLRPHLHQAYLNTERRRCGEPRLTPRQRELLRLVAVGHTNAQIARRLAISEGTVRVHLENIYERLQVSSRTAAVTRAFPDRAAV
jgi:DNA-binding CsgD family transcriptional regulator